MVAEFDSYWASAGAGGLTIANVVVPDNSIMVAHTVSNGNAATTATWNSRTMTLLYAWSEIAAISDKQRYTTWIMYCGAGQGATSNLVFSGGGGRDFRHTSRRA